MRKAVPAQGGHSHVSTGDAMTMNWMNITNIAPPERPATDHGEAELKAALDPIVSELLDIAVSAGWDRRKSAYTIMVLAARTFLEKNSGQGTFQRADQFAAAIVEADNMNTGAPPTVTDKAWTGLPDERAERRI